MVERKMVTGQGYGLGIGGCKKLCRREGGSYDSRQVTDLLSRAHTCVWALGKLVALLSRIRLFPDRLSGFYFGGGGPCTALSPGLRGRGLESQFGWGPGHPGQESDGLVLLVPGVQAGRVFSGYPARGIDS